MYGYSENQALKMNITDLVPEDKKKDTLEIIERTQKAGVAPSFETKRLTKDGRLLNVWITVTPLLDYKDDVVALACLERDITEVKSVEMELRQAQANYHEIFDKANDAIFVHDIQTGQILDVNAKMLEMCGYRYDESLKLTVEDISLGESPYSQKEAVKYIQQAAEGTPQLFEWLCKTSNGRHFWAEVSLKKAVFRGAERVIAVVRDINEKKKAEQLMLASEERFRATFEQAAVGIAHVALNGRFLRVNQRLCEILGFSKQEMLQRTVQDITYPDDLQIDKDLVRRILEGKIDNYSIEQRCYHKNGHVIWINLTVTLLRDQQGEPKFFISVVEDITSRKQIEDALKQEVLQKSAILRGMNEHMMYQNLDREVVWVNKAAAQTAKLPMEQIVGKKCHQIWYKCDTICPNCPVEKVKRTGQPVKGEITTPDGQIWSVRAYPVKDEQETIQGIVEIALNITERKKSVQALRQSEEKFRQFFENEPEYCYIVSKNGEIIDINSSALRMLGYQKQDILGKPITMIYADPSMNKLKKLSEIRLRTDRITDQEMSVITNSGEKRYVLLSESNVKDQFGTILYSISVQKDITETKQAEKDLLDYQKRLKALASQLSLAEERERRRIATELHDQIAQSLVISKVQIESLAQSGQFTKDKVVEIAKSLDSVIQQVRSLTFDLGSPILYELGFEEAVAEWLDEHVHDQYGIETEFIDDGIVKHLDDDIRVLLFRTVRELLINVVKHAKAEKVTVLSKAENGNIFIEVKDNGIGFDSSEVNPMPDRKKGYGLFSIRERLEHMGGSMEIFSQPQKGCKIIVTAPMRQSQTTMERRV